MASSCWIASPTPTSMRCGPERTTASRAGPVVQARSRGETSRIRSGIGRSTGNAADSGDHSPSARQGRDGWWAAACSRSIQAMVRSPSSRTGSSRPTGVAGTRLARSSWRAGTRSTAWASGGWSCASSRRTTPRSAWQQGRASCGRASSVGTIAATADVRRWCSSRVSTLVACGRDHPAPGPSRAQLRPCGRVVIRAGPHPRRTARSMASPWSVRCRWRSTRRGRPADRMRSTTDGSSDAR